MEITSNMIIKADCTTAQNIKKGTGIKTPHIQDGAVTTAKIGNEAVTGIKIANGAVIESKLGDNSVTSSKIRDGSVGNAEIANGAVTSEKLANDSVTYEKLDSNTRGKLVTNGNTHDHSGGNGAQIRHSSLNKDDGRNPHGTTAADVGAASESYVNNYVNNQGYATRSYVDSSNNSHISSQHGLTQVNASTSSKASADHSQVNACSESTANGYLSQVNASSSSSVNGTRCQVNASHVSDVSNHYNQVNASVNSSARGDRSQVNASECSRASGFCSQVNASYESTTGGTLEISFCQVNASCYSTASAKMSQVNASSNSSATHWNSQVNASIAVATADHNTVCGGYGEGKPSKANRKWELNSKTGTLTLKNSVINSFSDYGEYFENLKKGEIDMGLLMALEGAAVRPAKKDEDFIGVVSGTAAIRLGDSPFCWQGRYMKDEWGRPVYKEIKDPAWQPKTMPDDKWKPKDGETEADRPMIAVETKKERPTIRVQKENPDYDPKREQEPRSGRPQEWTLVGLLGQVYVRCDETVQPGDFVKSKDKGIGTKSEEKTKLRAMKVTKEFDGKYSIVYCLLN